MKVLQKNFKIYLQRESIKNLYKRDLIWLNN